MPVLEFNLRSTNYRTFDPTAKWCSKKRGWVDSKSTKSFNISDNIGAEAEGSPDNRTVHSDSDESESSSASADAISDDESLGSATTTTRTGGEANGGADARTDGTSRGASTGPKIPPTVRAEHDSRQGQADLMQTPGKETASESNHFLTTFQLQSPRAMNKEAPLQLLREHTWRKAFKLTPTKSREAADVGQTRDARCQKQWM
ncbi:uncharacterized protein PV07_12801 [Cladophialophora immunda]|uniref:Uncharacterized protein n=1 Tax=Cladophialophora immunda TaxID=569365 RepID=A0A0D2BTL9_9EURO|nr:uncharacterized protein PV07_12801 [Cladophialophora immunda]KIW21770.1 hypothetical protein PV07_12801 [Cladophialophora immunda]